MKNTTQELITKYEEKLSTTAHLAKVAVGRDAKNAYSAQANILREVLRDLKALES